MPQARFTYAQLFCRIYSTCISGKIFVSARSLPSLATARFLPCLVFRLLFCGRLLQGQSRSSAFSSRFSAVPAAVSFVPSMTRQVSRPVLWTRYWPARLPVCVPGGHRAGRRQSWPFTAAPSRPWLPAIWTPVWRWPTASGVTAASPVSAAPPAPTVWTRPCWRACAATAAARWNWASRAFPTRPCRPASATTAAGRPPKPAAWYVTRAWPWACSCCPACRAMGRKTSLPTCAAPWIWGRTCCASIPVWCWRARNWPAAGSRASIRPGPCP